MKRLTFVFFALFIVRSYCWAYYTAEIAEDAGGHGFDSLCTLFIIGAIIVSILKMCGFYYDDESSATKKDTSNISMNKDDSRSKSSQSSKKDKEYITKNDSNTHKGNARNFSMPQRPHVSVSPVNIYDNDAYRVALALQMDRHCKEIYEEKMSKIKNYHSEEMVNQILFILSALDAYRKYYRLEILWEKQKIVRESNSLQKPFVSLADLSKAREVAYSLLDRAGHLEKYKYEDIRDHYYRYQEYYKNRLIKKNIYDLAKNKYLSNLDELKVDGVLKDISRFENDAYEQWLSAGIITNEEYISLLNN